MNYALLHELEEKSSIGFLDDESSCSGLTSSYVEEKYSKEDIDELVENGYIVKSCNGYYITRRGLLKNSEYAVYRKKPVEIRAFQITEKVYNYPEKWPEWIHRKRSIFRKNGKLIIQTLEGPMKLPPNNWVIEGVRGELYSCAPEIFEKTYEKV